MVLVLIKNELVVSRNKAQKRAKEGKSSWQQGSGHLEEATPLEKSRKRLKPMERISKLESKPHSEVGFQLLKGHFKRACTSVALARWSSVSSAA